MWAEERRQLIIDALSKSNRLTAAELSQRFDVSRETIRRDLKDLAAEGLISRTHGGALARRPEGEAPFQDRVTFRKEAKHALTAAAAKLVSPGDCCFIDAGTTTASFGQALAKIENISVITNSPQIALSLREHGSPAEIMLLGGTFGVDVPGTYGPAGIDQLKPLRADIAFVSPVGIHPEHGVSYFDLNEAETASAMLRNARRKVILADASKCGLVSRMIVCPCGEIDILVSDTETPEIFLAAGVGDVVSVGAPQGSAA